MSTLMDALIDIRVRTGSLKPEAVVDAARDPEHQLHDRFEWDDAVAGERYRVEQARELIRSVEVRYIRDDGTDARVRGFVSVQRTGTPTREYVPVSEVAVNPDLTVLALRDAEREWRLLYSRYKHLDEFVKLVARDIDDAA